MIFWVLVGFLLLGLTFTGYTLLEARRVQHRRVELFLDNLPEGFDGYTILYLTDPHFQREDKRKTRTLANLSAPPPDLCVVTGDLIEKDDAILTCQKALAALPARDGVFYVLGNHDYFQYSLLDAFLNRNLTDRPNDVTRLIRVLDRAGLRLLRNQSVPLRRGDATIWLAGVDDPVTGRDNLAKTLSGIPAGAFSILLSHSPDILHGAILPGEHLVLAGHTHGGQILLPFWGPVKNHSKLKPGFVSGKLPLPQGTLLVSNGLGVNHNIPFRFRCRPEVLTLRLRKRCRAAGDDRAGVLPENRAKSLNSQGGVQIPGDKADFP